MIVPALIVSDPARGNGLGVVRGGGRGFDPVAGKPARCYFGWHFLGLDLLGVRILAFDPGWFYPSEFGYLALHIAFVLKRLLCNFHLPLDLEQFTSLGFGFY